MPYATIQDVRDAGLSDEDLFPDASITAALLMWEQFIDRVTRQFFEPREAEVELDGTDSDTLHFSVPVISVEELYLNGSSEPLDTTLYKVYNGRMQPTDDRKNPRLKLIYDMDVDDIYVRPVTSSRLKFRKGRKNQRLVGTFGYTMPDDSTPLLIQRALVKLVIEKLTNPIYPDPDNPIEPVVPHGPLLEEETDDHRMKYAASGGSTRARSPGLIGITTDREILDILTLYRSPIAIATPAHYTYR